jgi:hypothetical protein
MPCEYYDRPEVVARKEKDYEILDNGRRNPFILYVHHFQVEEELGKYRDILKNLIVKNIILRNDLPIRSLTLDETVRAITDYEQINHEYPSLMDAKDLIKKTAAIKHSSRQDWELKNDEMQRQSMNENLKKYQEAENK